jgi:integrase
MLPHCSHITAKRGRFYYRRRLPLPHEGEVALALRTANYREAQHLASVLDNAFNRFFSSPLPMKDLNEILREHLKEAIEADLEQHQGTPFGRPVYTSLRDEHQDPVDADLELVDHLLSDAREALARRDVRSVAATVDRMMVRHCLPEEMRIPLAFGVLRVNVQAWERSRDHVVNGAVDPIDLIPNAVSPVVTTPAPSDLRKLSDRLPDFLDLMTTEEGWRGQTLAQNQATYRYFAEVCGDRRPDCYTRQDLATFYDTLRKLPALYSKKPVWRGLSLIEIVEKTREVTVGRLAMKTVKRHFSALGRLFDYFKRRGEFIGENPAHGFEFPKKGRANKARQMWEGDRLARLFASPVWTGCQSESRRSVAGKIVIKDSKYWLPLLALYHGNRLEEFAQLRREDIKRDDGIWYFDIHDGGDRQIKNEQSKRRVPVHPAVTALGFLDYIDKAAPKSSDMVFPELLPGGPDKKFGFYFTKWWSRYRQEIGLFEKGLDYHSFRHGVTTKLYAAGVSEAIVDELTGHEGQGTSRIVYKKEMPLRVLFDAVSKVEWSEISIPTSTR